MRAADPVPSAGPAEGRRLHHSDRGTPPGLLSPPHSHARRETRTPQSDSAPGQSQADTAQPDQGTVLETIRKGNQVARSTGASCLESPWE